ncbi:TonB family protein [Citreicella sp. C3M06]|uniref:energy transducer TonB family protein n=1 Tax=Citreicella sp. C3M06 TaxID=2841564 RepID=UPI001C09D902|nr:energy transducer TonB [Citreicella sp. C3M06]MBU2961786.1 TonB family protein [Citreicella sp. C3M06]
MNAVRTSRAAKLAAALLACGAHGALALALMQTEPPVKIEGASGGEAALGSSFADMSRGTLTSEPTEEVLTPEATPTQPTEPEQAIAPEPAPQRAAETAVAPSPEPLTPEPLTPSAEPDVIAALPPETAEPAKAEPPDQPTPLAAEDTPSDEAVAVSRRPAVRPDTLTPPPKTEAAEPTRKAEAAEPTKKPRAEPAPKRQQAPQGNAERSARAGQATGSDNGRAASSGQGGKSDAAGNAAASNYPGEVMRKLSRVARPRLNTRGSAVIAFNIGGNGGLAGLSVARSSGSAALDQAALRVVQRAAPFPAPPSGARRSFSIEIKAR